MLAKYKRPGTPLPAQQLKKIECECLPGELFMPLYTVSFGYSTTVKLCIHFS